MPRATPLAARNDTPKVGARVRSLRRERGLTIEQLAAATGLTKGFISQLERDRTAPSLSSIARICDALGVRLSHIFEREPAPALVRRQERVRVDTAFSTESHLLSSRDEQHALLGTHVHGQGHIHVREDDEVFQGNEQHRAQAITP